MPREAVEPLILMLSPVAPHVCEELWSKLGHPASLAREPFPTVTDPSLLEQEQVTAVVQVKGKLRDRFQVSPDITEEELTALALGSEKVQRHLDGEPRKIIVRLPKLINIVP